jgi:pimeloyl-ACP methyl ester carboxylesterase
MRIRLVALAAAAVAVVAPVRSARAADAEVRLAPCRPAGVEETVRCGDLLVPENPREPEGRQIELHVVVLPALDGGRRGAPVFGLAGGPGGSATSTAAICATLGPIRRQHDVVLVDQRGTGESSPLRCPELEFREPFEEIYPPEVVERCRKTLAKGADLAQYTTANAVADLDVVRSRLGYEKIDLFGHSYGGRLALAYLRTHPDRVRAVATFGAVADGKKMPLWDAQNTKHGVDEILRQCAADESCNRAFPDLRNEWDGLLRHLAQGPMRAQARVDGRETAIVLRLGPFVQSIRDLLLTTGDQLRLPYLVHHMARGDFAPYVERMLAEVDPLAEGLYLSTLCAGDTPRITAEERASATVGTFIGTYRVDRLSAACRAWNVPLAAPPE